MHVSVMINAKPKPDKNRDRRANFGVQQWPLCNRLKPESEIGDSLSSFQGRRRLNTSRTRKFALRRTSRNIFCFSNFAIYFFIHFFVIFFFEQFRYIEK